MGAGGWARCWRSLWAAVGLSNARRLNRVEVADHHPKEKEIAVGVCNTRGLTGVELALCHGKEEEICLLLLGLYDDRHERSCLCHRHFVDLPKRILLGCLLVDSSSSFR